MVLRCLLVKWKNVKAVYLPKLGQETYIVPKLSRTISPTSFLLKILDKLTERYLRNELLTKEPLHKDLPKCLPNRKVLRVGHA